MVDKASSDLWWKDAVIYCVDVKTFLDSDGDGWGDLAGLTRRLDYLRELGVNCLWLTPFYPSPLADDGYDISDYYAVDHRLGTLGDFVELARTAHALGMRVVLDLVINHTSIEHPWFRERPEYYVWADEPQPDSHGVVFPGEQTETWTCHEETGRFYFHRYYEFQPDLNIANPAVRDELNKIIGFWLQLGADGFRIDSLPFLIDKSGIEDTPEVQHGYLRDMRSFLTRRKGDAVFIGEANVPPDEQRPFFGDPRSPHEDSEAQLLFDFATQAALWLAVARGTAEPVARSLQERPAYPHACQYGVFVRHHDELTFEHVTTEQELAEALDIFAPEEDQRIYGRGARRRLAPLLDNDQNRIRLMLATLFALPGTPILLYGDEIGLGDNLALKGRLAVRVPMQWSNRANGGFSTGPPENLVRPLVEDGEYGYQTVNMVSQRSDPYSQLTFTREVIAARRSCPEIGWGEWEVIGGDADSVLTVCCRWQGGCVVTMHNFAADPVRLTLDTDPTEGEEVREMLCDQEYPAVQKLAVPIDISGHGFRWFRIASDPTQTPG